MTPEGYKKIEEALPSHYQAEPKPEEDEDLLFVTVHNKDLTYPIIPAEILNKLIEAGLMHKNYDLISQGGESPRLEEHHTGEYGMTFRDHNAVGPKGANYHLLP